MSGSARAVFIAGAGTEIGKTYVTAALTRRLRQAGRSVRALKPLASGVPPVDDPAFASSDTGVLLAAQGLPVDAQTAMVCSPWRFRAPLAPDLAAAREGRSLTLDALVAWCESKLSRAGTSDLTLIEGVGGVMSPVTADATGLDWLERQRLPALLVSGSYLGAISHALTALETLRAHGVTVLGIVVNESLQAPTRPEIVAESIARHGRLATIVFHRNATCPDDLLALVAPADATIHSGAAPRL